MEKDSTVTKRWSDEQKAPYLYKGDQWVGYDNVTSLQLKVSIELWPGGIEPTTGARLGVARAAPK